MKKQLFILLFLSSTSLQTIAQPSYVPTNGLVGWWPFNGDANDESGNNNNGTVNGATLTTDRFGNSNSSYNFNVNNWTWGANGDFIYIPYNPSFNFTEFTVSAWVNRASDGATISPQGLSVIRRFEYGYSNPNGESWTLDIAHGTSAEGAIVYGAVIEQSTSPAPNSYCSTTQTIPVNQWSHLMMTYSQSTLKIYIDGILVCTTNDPSIVINTIGNSGISIGLSLQANGHWGPFDGKIDDIGIWNRALSETEIATLYNGCFNSLTSQPNNQSITLSASTSAQFSVTSSATSPIYQWQTNLGLGFQNLSDAGQYSGTSTNVLSVNNITMANNNQQFRCIVAESGCEDTTDVVVLTVIDDLGFSEYSNLFQISPNPATSHVTISTQEARFDDFTILDAQGRIIQEGKLTGKSTLLDLSRMASGNYLLRIGHQQTVLKLVKE
jgi:hypothetical protein